METKNVPIPKLAFIVLFVSVLVFCDSFSDSSAQGVYARIEIPSSYNPVGSGARALGMGGAFIAIADDATSASWNPGGLIQLERPEVAGVGAYFYRSEDLSFGTNPEGDGSQSVDMSKVNYASASYPFTLWDYNMIVSLNYQNLYDFTRDWEFPLNIDTESLTANQNIGFESEGQLGAIGLAYCTQITPRLSLGFTLNFWEDSLYENEWETRVYQNGAGFFSGYPVNYTYRSFDKYNFDGFNANLGFMWNITDKITLGGVFKTPFDADLRHKNTTTTTQTFPTAPESDTSTSTSFSVDETLDMPMSYGIGFAYRFSDAFSMSADVYRTQWDDFEQKDANGNRTSPVNGKPIHESGIDATTQVRLGAEYLIIEPKYLVPVRAGLFYDPAPAEGSPDDFYGVTVGTGLGIGRFIFDIAYQYRFGNDVAEYILENKEFSMDVDEHTVYASLIIHF